MATLDARRGKKAMFGKIVEAVVTRLVGAILLEQNDEWAIQRRYLSLETFTAMDDAAPVRLPAVVA